MGYGFGNHGNSNFEQSRQNNNKFTNGVAVGNQNISPQMYKQLIARATQIGYTLEQFIQFRAQTMQYYNMEPETYIIAKQLADQNGFDVKMFVPYIQRGINDLRFALNDLMSKGVIANAIPGTGMAVEPVVAGLEEISGVIEMPDNFPKEVETVPLQNNQIQQIEVPDSILNPMGNENCDPSNIPLAPEGDPANNPNTYNQEPLQKIGDGLTPPPAPEQKPETPTYSKEMVALAQKYGIHPDTLIMLKNNADHFKGVDLDEYIQIAIAANREGVSVLQYYTVYMQNNKKQGSAVNSTLKEHAAETDIIINNLIAQAQAIQNKNNPKPAETSGVGRKVAYGQSKMDAGSVQEGGFIGSTNIDQEYSQTAYGNGIESKKELTQPVFGAKKDKDVKVGQHRTVYGNGVSGIGSRQKLSFGTN